MGRLNRDLGRLIFIDTKALAFMVNPDNGIFFIQIAIPVYEFIADNSMED